MIWKKFSVTTTEEVEDLIAEFMNENGAEGVQIEDNMPLSEDDLKAMYVDVPLINEDDGSAIVSAFLEPDFDVEGLKVKVEDELKRLSEFLPVGIAKVTIEDTEDDSTWANKYKEFFKPFRMYDDIVVEPVWEEYADKKADDHVIKIESVSAFGTGTHETTRLCMGQLRKYLKPGDTVFDVGCGSGILAITAVKLGAGYVHGMDIDPQAIRSSYENAEVNGYDRERIGFTCGNLLDRNYITDAGTGDGGSIKKLSPDDYAAVNKEFHAPKAEYNTEDLVLNRDVDADQYSEIPDKLYDIVVANILAEVIMPLSAKVRPFMKKDAVFITSGISSGKEEKVRAAMIANGFEILDVIHMNDWVSIVAK